MGARPRQSLVETVGDVDTVADELAPERVGRYEIDRVLGRGAMGTVYLARDPSLDRKIAIKVLTPTLNRRKRSRRTARLVREAQAMARVAHGNTIEVLDVGVDGEGDVERVFIAMEYVDGGTLEEWLGAEVRTWREILTVFVAVGEALQAIHGAGLLHRDFKPDNVLMTADGRPIVTDFGLARLLGEEEEEDTASLGEGPTSRTERPTGQTGQTEGPPSVTARRWVDLTATGSALGTPRFMAPEQHLRGDLDARADQFAFCVALHRALFGTFPFEGQTLGELAANVADGRRVSPPPSFVPRRVRRAIFRGLSRRPQDRFADMGALVERVRIDGPRGRSRRVVAAVALVGMGATIALAVAAEGIRTPSARETAPAETALRTGELCSVAWPDSPPALQALSPASEAGRTYLRAWEERRRQWTYAHDFYCAGTAWATPAAGQLVCLDHARIQAEARFAVFATALPSEAGRLRREVERAPEPDWCLDSPYPFDTVGVSQLPNMVTIATQVVEAEALASLGRTEHASELIARTTDRIGTIEAPVLEARVWSAHGMIAAERGDYEAAAASYRTSQVAAESATDWAMAANAVVRQLGVIGINQGRAREALPLAEVAQAHLERIANPPRLRYALLRKWAAVLDTAGKHRESLRRLREALTLVTDQPVEETSVLADIAGVLNTLGETQESLHGFRAALRRAEKLPEYDDLAALLLNLANAEATAGERVAAREHARQARALFVERDGERGRTVAYCDNTLGMLYLEAGELDAARAHLTTGREIAVEVGDAMIAAAIARALSDVMVRQGDRDDAERLLARALVDAEADLGPEHVTVAGLHTEVAALAIDAGRESEARKHLDAATRVCTAPTVAARNCLARLRDLRERLDAFSRLRHRFRSMSGSR